MLSFHAAAGLAFASTGGGSSTSATKPVNGAATGLYLDRINWIHDGVFLWPFVSRRRSRARLKQRPSPRVVLQHSQQCQQRRLQPCSAAERSLAEGIHSCKSTKTVSSNCNKCQQHCFLPQSLLQPLSLSLSQSHLFLVAHRSPRNCAQQKQKFPISCTKGRGVFAHS